MTREDLSGLAELARTAPREDLPGLRGRLAEADAIVQMRLVTPANENGRFGGDPEALLLPVEVADRLRVPVTKVYDLLRAKHLVGIKNGKYWAIPARALEDYVQARKRVGT